MCGSQRMSCGRKYSSGTPLICPVPPAYHSRRRARPGSNPGVCKAFYYTFHVKRPTHFFSLSKHHDHRDSVEEVELRTLNH